MAYGGIEAGGTKWVCAIGDGPDELADITTFPTTSPEETMRRVTEFFTRDGAVSAVGVGLFGPVDLRLGSPTWGHITTTPKPGWANTDVVSALANGLDVPVAFDTDVNAAALGEHRWGAATGLDTFCYVTVGTGIGGGGMVEGRLMHGLSHPEFGHMRIPHDRLRDPFDGVCPYHGDCFEGLAAGPALRARQSTGMDEDDVSRLAAEYIALGLVNVVCALSPERIVLGGGVMKREGLIERVRSEVDELLAGYVLAPEIVPPALGDRSGVLGALELAREAV